MVTDLRSQFVTDPRGGSILWTDPRLNPFYADRFFGPSGAVATASGTFGLTGTAAGVAPVAAQGSGALPLIGSATGTVSAAGQAAGTLPLDGTATAAARAAGQAAGTLPLTGAATAAAPAKGQASGALPLTGAASAVAPSLIDYSTGRLSFAGRTGRTGRILNTLPREGTILNPRRAGKMLELTA